MTITRWRIVGLLVLVAGLAAALPFQRPVVDETDRRAQRDASGFIWRHPVPKESDVRSPPRLVAARSLDREPSLEDSTPEPADALSGRSHVVATMPPKLALSYEPLTRRSGQAKVRHPVKVEAKGIAATTRSEETWPLAGQSAAVRPELDQPSTSKTSSMGSRLGDPVFGDEPESESLHQVLDFGSESSLSATERATAETVSDRVPTAEEKPTGSPVGRTTRDDNFVRHRIIDGDTLEKLAARYLSSPDRWREIFDRNRGVLQSPDLLPIDAVLMIPVRSVRTPATRVDGGQ